MTIHNLSIVAVAAAIGVAAPVAAQRDYGRPVPSPENRADMIVRGTAACVYRTVPASARKALDSELASPEEAKRVRELTGVARSCFGGNVAMPPTLFRNALAEAAYRTQYQRSDPTAAETTPPESFAVAATGGPATPEQEVWRQMAAIAGCTVFADPAHAREWVTGPRNVEEEERRFVALRPAIGRCVPATVAGQLSARTFRGPVAAALLARAERATKVK